MPLRGATVREYLKSIRVVETITGATEHTYRASLTTFLTKAAAELGFGAISVRSELRLASVGQPDMQVVDAAGSAIGYGETKIPGTASRFADVLDSEQISRYRATLENLLVTDFLRITIFRPEVGRLDVVLSESMTRLAAGEYAVPAATLAQLSQVLSVFFSATAPAATSAEMLAGGLARRATLLRDAIRELLKPGNDEGDALAVGLLSADPDVRHGSR